MNLSDYSCESLTFSGEGAAGATAQQAAEALAATLNTWVATHTGRRILQLTTMSTPVGGGQVGLSALIVHTAGPELSGELAEQVALAIEDALEIEPVESAPAETNGPLHGAGRG
jgi:hypothetical protein